MNNLKKFFIVFPSLRANFLSLLLISLAVSFLDILGIGAISPFVALIISNDFYILFNSLIVSKVGLDLNSQQLLIGISLFIIIIFLIKSILSILILRKIHNYCYNEQTKLRKKILINYLKKDFDDFIKEDFQTKFIKIGEVTKISTEDALVNFLRFSTDLIVILSIVIFLVIFQTKISIALIIFFSFIFIFYRIFFQQKIYNIGKNTLESLKAIILNTEKTINSIREIKIFQKEKFLLGKMQDASEKYAKALSDRVMFSYLPKYLIEFIVVSSTVLAIIFFLGTGSDLESILPTLGLYLVAAIRLAPLTHQLLSSYSLIINSAYTIDQIRDFEFKESDEKFEIKKNLIQNVSKIEIKDLNFSYDQNKIFFDTQIKLEKNNIIGIFGPSGSGKTTLIYLLAGLIEIKSGKIYINEERIENNKHTLIGQLAYISQEALLISDTIKNNILFDNRYEEDKFKSCTSAANLDSFINELPYKENTQVGYLGNQISGGQRQRIAIARALYDNKPIIILDEPTNALDEETKSKIIETIQSLKSNRMIIIISHDEKIHNICDNVYNIFNKSLKKE